MFFLVKLTMQLPSLLKLRAAKVQSAPSAAPPSSNKAVAPGSEWQHVPQQSNQHSAAQQPQQSSSTHVANESMAAENVEDVSTTDDRGLWRLLWLFVISMHPNSLSCWNLGK